VLDTLNSSDDDDEIIENDKPLESESEAKDEYICFILGVVGMS
jgi:hypothetical protein